MREWIITALGNSNARSTRAALIRAGRTDPVRSVRVDAAKALCRFREKDARVKKFFKWYYSKPRSCVEQCYVPGGVNCDPDDGDDD